MGLSLLFLRLLKLHDLDLFLIYLFFVSFCFSFSFHPPSSLRTPTHHHYRIPLVKIKNTTHPPNLFIYIVCLFVGLMDHVLIPFNPPSVFDPHFPIIKRFRLNTHITHILMYPLLANSPPPPCCHIISAFISAIFQSVSVFDYLRFVSTDLNSSIVHPFVIYYNLTSCHTICC